MAAKNRIENARAEAARSVDECLQTVKAVLNTKNTEDLQHAEAALTGVMGVLNPNASPQASANKQASNAASESPTSGPTHGS